MAERANEPPIGEPAEPPDEPRSEPPQTDPAATQQSLRDLRDLAERVLLAALGAVSLTRERVDALADEVSARGVVSRDEARDAVDDAVARMRREGVRLGSRAQTTFGGVLRDVGVATRGDFEELELRVAQLEHRLALLEGKADEHLEPAPPDAA